MHREEDGSRNKLINRPVLRAKLECLAVAHRPPENKPNMVPDRECEVLKVAKQKQAVGRAQQRRAAAVGSS